MKVKCYDCKELFSSGECVTVRHRSYGVYWLCQPCHEKRDKKKIEAERKWREEERKKNEEREKKMKRIKSNSRKRKLLWFFLTTIIGLLLIFWAISSPPKIESVGEYKIQKLYSNKAVFAFMYCFAYLCFWLTIFLEG